MARIIIDTNVVLSHLLDRDPLQRSRARELFSSASRGENDLIVHQAIIGETVYVLANIYAVGTRELAAIVRDLLDTPGVTPVNDVSWTTVLALWPDRVADFGDACLAAAAKTGGFDSVATFDLGFAKQLRRLDLQTYWR